MKSVMKHQFSQVPRAQIPRSAFDRSHGYKTTFDGGLLIPIYVDEALPGDTFKHRMTAFARLATPIYPFMDNLRLTTFFFAVPNRLLWDNWEKFNGAQDNPGDSTDYLLPEIVSDSSEHVTGSIYDYMGLPVGINAYHHSALPLRAYNLIWNEWFRDQNLQNSVNVPKGDGPDSAASYNLLRRGKRHDYFTSCLPFAQKGDPVELPLGQEAIVTTQADTLGIPNVYSATSQTAHDLRSPGGNSPVDLRADPATEPDNYLYADLSNATAATINQIRQAFQIQKLLERDARGGTRYIELVKSHFGVTSPDARHQRPELLSVHSTPIHINPIAQTSSTDATTPQGNLAAIGTAGVQGHGYTKSFTEHCTIIGLISCQADLSYQQGLNRMWSRRTRYDFYWPALAHIGEQAVLNKEIYVQGDAVIDGNSNIVDNQPFGYNERFAEYRYFPSIISGRFKSMETDGTPLDAWHLSQDFQSLPLLNDTFIQDNPPIDRVIAVQTEPHLLFDSYHSLRCVRPMPLYGVPGLIDHF